MKQFCLLVFLFFLFTPVFSQTADTTTINFNVDKYELTTESARKLDAIADKIMQSGVGPVQLNGYCDRKGSIAYNGALSLKRAQAVESYFRKKNIPASALTAKGFGKNGLLNSERTEEEALQNRRVEIIFSIKQRPVLQVHQEDKSLTQMLEDSTATAGSTINIPGFKFYNNSDVPLPQSQPLLSELLNIMLKNPKLRISIEGHICCVAQGNGMPFNEAPSFTISVLRAKKIYDFLLNNGIDPGRLQYKGFGSSQPVYAIPEKTEAERIANRKVEIRIVDR